MFFKKKSLAIRQLAFFDFCDKTNEKMPRAQWNDCQKKRSIFGQYLLTIDAGNNNITVHMGNRIYETNDIGNSLKIGHEGKKLINIRPFSLSPDTIVLDRFIGEILPLNLSTLNAIQKNAVIAFCYDVKNALTEIGTENFVLNFLEASDHRLDNEYIKTDNIFYNITPSLTDIINKYVVNNS